MSFRSSHVCTSIPGRNSDKADTRSKRGGTARSRTKPQPVTVNLKEIKQLTINVSRLNMKYATEIEELKERNKKLRIKVDKLERKMGSAEEDRRLAVDRSAYAEQQQLEAEKSFRRLHKEYVGEMEAKTLIEKHHHDDLNKKDNRIGELKEEIKEKNKEIELLKRELRKLQEYKEQSNEPDEERSKRKEKSVKTLKRELRMVTSERDEYIQALDMIRKHLEPKPKTPKRKGKILNA